MPAYTPRSLALPFYALLAIALMPFMALTLAGASRADAADAAPARTSTVSVAVPNASFGQGARHWRATGRHARLQPSRLGHQDTHSLGLVSSRGTAALRQVDSSAPVTVANGRVSASVWVWSRLNRRVTAQLRTTRGHLVTGATRTLKAHTWQRLVMSHRVIGLQGTGLRIDVTAARTTRPALLLVDDVALHVAHTVNTGGNGSGDTTGNGNGSGDTGNGNGNGNSTGSGHWLSGASGDGVSDGSFGTWRGAPVQIAGTWNDDSARTQTNQWSLAPGGVYSSWQGDVDDAVGAIYAGETWAQAANGDFDARWRTTLTNLRDDWAGHTGTLYIRFAHEFNGDWYPWKVTGAQAGDFKTAWRRFRALQQEIFPSSKLVFCPNSVTSASNHLDWRDAFPGAKYVDVISEDFYNTHYSFIRSTSVFKSRLGQHDDTGAPVGLEAFRLWAKSQGLPFAVSEWSSDGVGGGDSPAFMRAFHTWLTQHGGTGAGEVLYEILFNVSDYADGTYELFPATHQANAASEYKQDW